MNFFSWMVVPAAASGSKKVNGRDSCCSAMENALGVTQSEHYRHDRFRETFTVNEY